MNFAKFLRTPYLQNTSGRLLLTIAILEGILFFHKTRVKTRGKTKVLQEKELNRLAHTNYRGYYFEKNR